MLAKKRRKKKKKARAIGKKISLVIKSSDFIIENFHFLKRYLSYLCLNYLTSEADELPKTGER